VPIATRHFSTLDELSELMVITVDCNNPGVGSVDLWPEIERRATAAVVANPHLHVVIAHTGNQIYADDIYDRFRNEHDSARFDEIVEAYRERYRRNYTHAPQSRVMSRFTNLMIADDREVCKEYGPRYKDLNHLVVLAGIRAIEEYQFQFHMNIFHKQAAHVDPHVHKIGGTRLIFIDTRIERYRQQLRGYLSGRQRELITGALADADGIDNVILLMSRPLFATSTAMTGSTLPDCIRKCAPNTLFDSGLYEQTSHKENLPDTMFILNELRQFREHNPHVETLLVGGGVRMGSIHNFTHRGGVIARQLTTSGVTAEPEDGSGFFRRLFKWFKFNTLCCANSIDDDWSYTQSAKTMWNNFGIIHAENVRTLPAHAKRNMALSIVTQNPDEISACTIKVQ
jgi:hypothetical protein